MKLRKRGGRHPLDELSRELLGAAPDDDAFLAGLLRVLPRYDAGEHLTLAAFSERTRGLVGALRARGKGRPDVAATYLRTFDHGMEDDTLLCYLTEHPHELPRLRLWQIAIRHDGKRGDD